MEDTKLVRVLATMDKKEVRAFGKYINALYGKYDAAMALFAYLKKAHPVMEGPRLRKEKVMAKTLPADTQHPEKRILNESSRLYQWLEEFLLLEKLREKDNPAREKLMAEIFLGRKLNHLFHLRASNFLNRHNPSAPPNPWAILNALYMQHLQYYAAGPQEGLHQNGGEALLGLIEKTDAFFLASRLKYGCELANRQNILQEAYAHSYLKVVEGAAAQGITADSLLHQAFFLAARLLERKRTEDYHELKHFFDAHHDVFTPDVRQVLHGYLLNFAAAQIRQMKPGFLEEAFALYEFQMDHQIAFEKEEIPYSRFINIISVACAQGMTGRAEKFARTCSPALPPESRQDILDVAKAIISFERKQYGSVRQLLLPLKHQDPLLEIRIRSYLLIAMAEEKEAADYLLGRCRNFEAYIRRNKVLGPKTTLGLQNFLKCLKKYIHNSVSPQTLEAEINACSEIFFRGWLLEKARERKH